jgi:dihydroorotate dehydrogenase
MLRRPMWTVLRPIAFRLDAETAHHRAIASLARVPRPLARLAGRFAAVEHPALAVRAFGLPFSGPVGIAAGLDKNAEAVEALAATGASHVEIGTVTGQAQPGNPQPRLFRLVADQAVINRMGFNNEGCAAVAARLRGRPHPPGVLGINIGKSKVVELEHALDDYRASVAALGPLADYLVVNVSSPNTPGLRDLQAEASLRPLLAGVRAACDAVRPGLPLLLKIAPDLADAGVDAAVDVALETGCDGLICTNTTIGRSGLATPAERIAEIGAGGLSGRPVRVRSTAVLARAARRIAGRIPVIGVGGIDSPDAAWEKICHGATLVQCYTGLIYQGPGLVRRIHRDLAARCERLGLDSIAAAVGRYL